jgi:hypothetical protein
LTLCVSVLDANVVSLDPSEVRKTLSKGVNLSRDGGVGFAREKAYTAVFPDCCCARTPSGVATAPPTRVMNSRRLISLTRGPVFAVTHNTPPN